MHLWINETSLDIREGLVITFDSIIESSQEFFEVIFFLVKTMLLHGP
jgi:hypothetical protein